MGELTNQADGNSGKVRSSAPVPRVDLTAMVDLAFLLITFFMLTTTFAKQNGMDLAMPVDGDPQPISAERTMTICLGDNNKMLWFMGTQSQVSESNLHAISSNEIRKALILNARNVSERTGKGLIVLIKPSDKSRYGNLVNILDEISVTQVPTYAIVDISKNDLDLMRSKQIY